MLTTLMQSIASQLWRAVRAPGVARPRLAGETRPTQSSTGGTTPIILLSLITVLALGASGGVSGSTSIHSDAAESEWNVEPQPAKEYLSAVSWGELPTSDDVVSPLNRVERQRRGLAATSDKLLDASLVGSTATANPMRFTYVGGTRDSLGFGHLLYLEQPAQGRLPSAWRVDVDPLGRVIWAELVYLFDEHSDELATSASGADAAVPSLPPDLATLHPHVIADIVQIHGREGYYLLTIPVKPASGEPGWSNAFRYVGIDPDGVIRPGVWSYGQASNTLAPYGRPTPTPVVIKDPALDSLLAVYISGL